LVTVLGMLLAMQVAVSKALHHVMDCASRPDALTLLAGLIVTPWLESQYLKWFSNGDNKTSCKSPNLDAIPFRFIRELGLIMIQILPNVQSILSSHLPDTFWAIPTRCNTASP